jgi:hypothetical protein
MSRMALAKGAVPGLPAREVDHAWGLMGWLWHAVPQRADADWPPAPVDGYWLPQTLRDVIITGYGEGAVGAIWYLCSIMERWRDRDGFAQSPDAAALIEWMSAKAADLAHDAPVVSVIVPVYGNLLDTMLCVASVLHAGGPAMEIIIADDASPDETPQIFGAMEGRCGWCAMGEPGLSAQLQRGRAGRAGAACGAAQQ